MNSCACASRATSASSSSARSAAPNAMFSRTVFEKRNGSFETTATDRLVQHLEDALARGGGTLSLPDPHAERAQGAHEHSEIEVEGDEIAGRERSATHHPRTGEQDGRLGEQRDKRDQRDVERPLPVG